METTRRARIFARTFWRTAHSKTELDIRTAAHWLSVTVLAIVLATAATVLILRPPAAHVAQLALSLTIAGTAALALGEIALRVASATRIGSVRVKLAVPPLLTAVVIALNVIALARAMFISPEDSVLLLVFLGFAVLVALVLASALAAEIACAIARIETGALRIAAGDYAFRVSDRDSTGSDELARLARWFNAMAANVERAFIQRDRAEADRRQMLAALSHDLRTPLTSIRAMIESIDEGVTTDDATVRRYQRAIRMEVRRLGTLLEDLFELSRLETGTLLPVRERQGIEDLVSDALEAFHEQGERHDVRLLGNVDAGLPLVAIDTRQIARVLANLVQNALRYAPAGGAALICAVRSHDAAGEEAILVRVVDSGPGIRVSDLARIFEPTYRSDTARARLGDSVELRDDGSSGAGLGLAIARGIVELHGGRIWAESPLSPELRAHLLPVVADPGAPFPGTALCFTLPLAV
jgi:two-component system, OmpR family, sensor histidine kinase SaeS